MAAVTVAATRVVLKGENGCEFEAWRESGLEIGWLDDEHDIDKDDDVIDEGLKNDGDFEEVSLKERDEMGGERDGRWWWSERGEMELLSFERDVSMAE